MKKSLNIGIISESALFRETLKVMLENFNKLKEIDYLVIKDLETDFRKLDVLIGDGDLKFVDKFTHTKRLYDFNKSLIRIIISEEKIINLQRSDICLVKPFRFLQIINIFHKLPSEFSVDKSDAVIRGGLTFSFSDKLLIYQGKKSVYLTDKESDIMLALMKERHNGIKKEKILYDVWGFSKNMSTHTFETHLYRLRKKIKDNLISDDLIINKNSTYFLNSVLLDSSF